MKRRVTTVLCALYVLGAAATARAAYLSYEHGQPGWVAMHAVCAVLFALAIAHHLHHEEELWAVRHDLERAARPPSASAIDGVVAVTLAGACCERWWTSAGREHEEATCSRKDSTA